MAKKRGLGRGLDSLLPRESTEQGRVLELDVDEIRPNPYQPRKDFSTEAMESLKESVEEHGVIQPILVKKVDQGYEIVAGERRYRAARMAELDKVPAIVVEVKSAKHAEMAWI